MQVNRDALGRIPHASSPRLRQPAARSASACSGSATHGMRPRPNAGELAPCQPRVAPVQRRAPCARPSGLLPCAGRPHATGQPSRAGGVHARALAGAHAPRCQELPACPSSARGADRLRRQPASAPEEPVAAPFPLSRTPCPQAATKPHAASCEPAQRHPELATRPSPMLPERHRQRPLRARRRRSHACHRHQRLPRAASRLSRPPRTTWRGTPTRS